MALLWLAVSAQSQALPAADEVLSALGLQHNQLAKLDQGEAVAQPDLEATEKELAMVVAMYLPFPTAKVFDYLQRAEVEAIDSDVTAHGEIPLQAGLDAFKHFAFQADQGGEIEGLWNAEPGERFNLSDEEIASFKSLNKELAGVDREVQAKAVSQHYRKILLGRWQAYSKAGLAGIAPYAHPDGEPNADPAAELRTAAENDKALSRYYPELKKAWLDYPSGMPSGVLEQFFWLNRKVEDRPTAILGQRLVQSSPEGAVIAIRHFYVGHSYNSTQLVIGCLPYRKGTVVFYAQRTSTDQVAGMAAGLKHSIGRERMREQMEGRLESLHKALRAGR